MTVHQFSVLNNISLGEISKALQNEKLGLFSPLSEIDSTLIFQCLESGVIKAGPVFSLAKKRVKRVKWKKGENPINPNYKTKFIRIISTPMGGKSK